MARYSIDVRAALTAYVEAADAEAAIDKVIEYFGTERTPAMIDLFADYMDMTGEQDGTVTLSPAVTFWGRFEDDEPELVDDDGCATCAEAVETRAAPCDECGALNEAE